MPAYIVGSGIISPQPVWEKTFPQPVSHSGSHLTCIEPDYNPWIPLTQQRRMSRVIKMGVTAALMALKEAALSVPDGIITGTGLGCLQDTGQFLAQTIEKHEQALNPTPFIQSTHNTIGSQIALMLQAQGYNQTYAHDGSSFESALIDALLQIDESPDQSLLVGGIDEVTDYSYGIQRRLGLLRKASPDSLTLFARPGHGTLLGEGSAWFALTGKPRMGVARIDGVTTVYKPKTSELEDRVDTFLQVTGTRREEIDLVISGYSGDERFDEGPSKISELFASSSIAVFKHLCGEYPVAAAFALSLAAEIAKTKQIPASIVRTDRHRIPNRMLIYNQYFGIHHSFILLRSC